MAALRPSDDPYRILGILRGADLDQIKSAHRRLAKRFHPDRVSGDEQRFLAVQEAYQLLSDPARRREWDRLHSSTPSRAARRSRTQGQRTTTWSAEHVPWWEDLGPRRRRRNGEEAPPPEAPSSSAAAAHPEADSAASSDADRSAAPTIDFDVFSRSSGAAWSMAARRHFRRDDADLPSRGAWRYRGTQVVTGAEARQVAAEEAAEEGATQAAERARHEADR